MPFRGQTDHGQARLILLKEVIPALERVEIALFEACKEHPAWEPYFERLKLARDRAEVAENLLRQGG